MKRFAIVAALSLALGVMPLSSPADAAAGTKCAKPSGKIALSPGLTSVKKVQTITINLPVKACVGGGVKSGVFTGKLVTEPISVASFAASTKPLKLTSKIVWNTKKTTTFTATTTTKIVAGKITSSIKGKVTTGLFKGLTASSTQTVTLGPLVGGAIKNLTITGTTAFTIK